LAIGDAIAKADMTIQCSFGKSALGFFATLGHAANFQRAETITAPLTIEKRKNDQKSSLRHWEQI
jgi:hypothetical protein